MVESAGAQTPWPHRWRALGKHLSKVKWRWVLLVGLIIPLLTLMLGLLIGDACSKIAFSIPSVYERDHKPTVEFCQRSGDYGATALNLLLTLAGAAWATRRVGRDPLLHGALIGILSALIGLAVALLYGMTFDVHASGQDRWNTAMLVLTVAAGWMGGLSSRPGLVQREALYRASRAVVAADNPQDIVAAIGEHLVGAEINQVLLWQVDTLNPDGAVKEISLLAGWAPQGRPAQPAGRHLDARQVPSLARLRPDAPLLLRPQALPPAERTAWKHLGTRAILFLPLSTSDEAWEGLLTLSSPSPRGLRRGIWSTELLGAQVALALENQRLLKGARQAAVLEERQRLAREIHDTLAQGFTSIVMHLEAAEQALPEGSPTTQQHLDQARQTARESLVQARRLVWALRPEILERDPLPAALERLVRHWTEESGISASTTVTGTGYLLAPDVEVTLLRATQEALSNVRKHARANLVAVTLSYMGDVVVLDVQDDGLGFNSAQPRSANGSPGGGFGLTAMRERAEQLGGSLFIESVPGQGTTLVVEIPTSTEAPPPEPTTGPIPDLERRS